MPLLTAVLGTVRRQFLGALALFVALSGTAYAATALPKNSVGTPQLKKEAVTSAKVKDGSLGAGDFARGALPAGPRGPVGPAGPRGPGAVQLMTLQQPDPTVVYQNNQAGPVTTLKTVGPWTLGLRCYLYGLFPEISTVAVLHVTGPGSWSAGGVRQTEAVTGGGEIGAGADVVGSGNGNGAGTRHVSTVVLRAADQVATAAVDVYALGSFGQPGGCRVTGTAVVAGE